MKNSSLPVLFVFIISVLIAVLPLFGKKYIPTHDGEYHIIRIVEFSKMLRAGYWFPRWAPDMNSGYGIPIFEYNYPFPNYIGAAVRVITGDAVRAFQISEGLGFVVAALALFFWLYTLFGMMPAAAGATVGMFVPYWFVDLYVRGSIGEIWASAFLFVSLFFVERKKYAILAIIYALLIFSHNILAMLYTPFLLVYILIRNKHALWSVIAGLGLAACFWVPALLEKVYVVGLNTVNFREHFVQLYELLIPSWGTEFSGTGTFGNKISFQIGIVPLLVATVTGVMFRSFKDRDKIKLLKFFYITIGISVLLMFPVSRAVWDIVTPLQLMQYPWRLLAFVFPVSAFSAAFIVSKLRKSGLAVLIAVFAVVCTYSYSRPVLYEPRTESYYLSRRNFTDGTNSMGNSFSTIWTGWKQQRSPELLTVSDGIVLQRDKNRLLDNSFTVSLNREGLVTVHQLYFPGWKVFLDKKEIPVRYQSDGIIHVAVPAGVHTLRVVFTDTLPPKAGNQITVISFAVFAAYGILRIRNTKYENSR